MDCKDRIAVLAALALILGICAFVVAHSEQSALGTYYYFSDSPDPCVNQATRDFAIQNNLEEESTSEMISISPPAERLEPVTGPIRPTSSSAKKGAEVQQQCRPNRRPARH